MKVLLIYNSYPEQLQRLKRLLKLVDPLPTQDCTTPRVCFDVVVALKIGEAPLPEFRSIQVNSTSPHRRWFLSAFVAFESYAATYDWYFILDGDSVVFLKQLEPILNKYPDPRSRSWYLGGLTESFTSFSVHGIFPYGGGGALISFHAIDRINATKNACMQKYVSIYGGDEVLFHCFKDVGVEANFESSFHQMDVLGDVTGLFETYFTQTGLVTLHHISQTYLGNDTVETWIPLLTSASNALDQLFATRMQLNSSCKTGLSNGHSRNFLLTNGVTLVEFKSTLARYESHLFDSSAVIKTHRDWAYMDHNNHSMFSGKYLLSPNNKHLNRQYLHKIRANITHIIQDFVECDVVTEILSRKTHIVCNNNCAFDPSLQNNKLLQWDVVLRAVACACAVLFIVTFRRRHGRRRYT